MKIVCDSMADMPRNIINKYDVKMLPLLVNLEGNEYLDGVDLTHEEFYKMLRTSNETPKTSQITYARFKEFFDEITSSGEDVLYIGGSSKASGTYQSAVIASSECEGTGKVYTFDTHTLSICAGLFVVKACELKEQGLSPEEIICQLEKLKGTETSALFVDDLKYLQKGGRISGAKATVGTLLRIKPVLVIEDGLVATHSQVRGSKQVYNTIMDITLNHDKDLKDRTIFIGYCDNIEGLEGLKNTLSKHIDLNSENVHFVNVGAGVASHSGPSVVAIGTL